MKNSGSSQGRCDLSSGCSVLSILSQWGVTGRRWGRLHTSQDTWQLLCSLNAGSTGHHLDTQNTAPYTFKYSLRRGREGEEPTFFPQSGCGQPTIPLSPDCVVQYILEREGTLVPRGGAQLWSKTLPRVNPTMPAIYGFVCITQ